MFSFSLRVRFNHLLGFVFLRWCASRRSRFPSKELFWSPEIQCSTLPCYLDRYSCRLVILSRCQLGEHRYPSELISNKGRTTLLLVEPSLIYFSSINAGGTSSACNAKSMLSIASAIWFSEIGSSGWLSGKSYTIWKSLPV